MVSSPRPKVRYSVDVKEFLRTLSSEESKLFNECLEKIRHDPHADQVDGKRRVKLYTRMPIVDILFRDENFVVIYYLTRITKPSERLYIEVFQVARVRDLEEGNAPPRR